MRLAYLYEAKYDYCSTQFNVKDPQIFKLIERISNDDLSEDGKEENPHVTVKFGLYEANPRKLYEVVNGFGNVKIKLGPISLFKSDAREVVKIEVISNDLHRLNRLISKNIPNVNTFPNYVPHITLAYVLPGEGDKYVGNHPLINKRYTFNTLYLSNQDGEQIQIPLANIN